MTQPEEKPATESVGARLDALHHAVGDEPLSERIDEASCGPTAKRLMHLAMCAAEAGGTPGDSMTPRPRICQY
jgi:hypothetical protein